MISKELELQKNAQTEKRVDDDKISLHVIILLEKYVSSPRNGTTHVSVSSATSNSL